MFYKIIVECGHMGAGNSFDRVLFIKGENPLIVLQRARTMPQVKRKETSLAVKLIKEISKEEYVNGINSKKASARYC